MFFISPMSCVDLIFLFDLLIIYDYLYLLITTLNTFKCKNLTILFFDLLFLIYLIKTHFIL